MKKYEYKTEHVCDADFVQFVNDQGSVGWRFVRMNDEGFALFEREIEADTKPDKPDSEQDEYDVIPADGRCYISIAGIFDYVYEERKGKERRAINETKRKQRQYVRLRNTHMERN